MKEEKYYFSPEDEDDGIIDISSSSRVSNKHRINKENPISVYSNSLFKNLGTIIKVISFIIAFAMIGISFVIGYFLFSFFDNFFFPIAIGVVLVGTIISAFTFFIIYGIGHAICQNDEILRRSR